MNYLEWLQNAAKQLDDAGIKTARLDALVLLQAATGTDRAHIIAYPETVLDGQNLQVADGYLERRVKREPVAYILGTKEFYGRDFIVTPDVLVPRPESESFIELLPKFGPLSGKHLLDVGTGSGALAITAKLENPKLQVVGSDISAIALNIARENAAQLNADVDFAESSLLQDITDDFDIIVANLPYVPPDYKVEPELDFEPALALYAEHGGLQLIEELFKQTPGKLLPGGVVLVESLQSQHADVKRIAKEAGLRFNQKNGLIIAFTY